MFLIFVFFLLNVLLFVFVVVLLFLNSPFLFVSCGIVVLNSTFFFGALFLCVSDEREAFLTCSSSRIANLIFKILPDTNK